MDNKNNTVKTKIIATLGPSSNSPDKIKDLILMGMNVARINMSHFSNINDFEGMIKSVRQESFKCNQHVGILVDLAGPKIRLDLNKDYIEIEKNKVYSLGYDIENDFKINSDLKFDEIFKKKSFIKIDDGKVLLEVVDNDKDRLFIKSSDNHKIKNKKGVNFPDIKLDIEAVTETDKNHVLLAIKNNVDWLALSFVREDKDIDIILDIFKDNNHFIPVLAKIEKPEAILNLDSIINKFDGILIARGDLGVEIPLAKLPSLQKTIIEKCHKSKKPVIIATQILESMIENPSPTRAEVNDVANAVYESVDAVMLSGETAVGKYPIETVKIMQEIILNTEKEVLSNNLSNNMSIQIDGDIRSAIGEATKSISKHLNVDAIIVMTESGSTGIMVSQYRPFNPIFALTPNKSICSKLSLVWGVVPILTKKFSSTDEMLVESEKLLVKQNYLKCGDTFVLTSGVPVGIKGTTNMLRIHKVSI